MYRKWEFRLREKELKGLGLDGKAAVRKAANQPDTPSAVKLIPNEAPSDEELQAMASRGRGSDCASSEERMRT